MCACVRSGVRGVGSRCGSRHCLGVLRWWGKDGRPGGSATCPLILNHLPCIDAAGVLRVCVSIFRNDLCQVALGSCGTKNPFPAQTGRVVMRAQTRRSSRQEWAVPDRLRVIGAG